MILKNYAHTCSTQHKKKQIVNLPNRHNANTSSPTVQKNADPSHEEPASP